MPRNYRDGLPGDTELAGKEIHQLVVRRAVNGRGMEPHFQCRPVCSRNFASRGARLDVYAHAHASLDGRYRETAHSSRSTADCMNPIRKYAMMGVMSIGPIVGMTCRSGLRIGSLTT
jgi:hypothetical protein